MGASEHPRVAHILRELKQRGLTLATAESLTGGLLADAFVSVAGASAVFTGGVVSYATGVKASLLGVDATLLAARGAVDPDVALQMARGVRFAVTADGTQTDIGVATTGVAGPDPADGHPVGTVFVAVSTPDGGQVVPCQFTGSRADIRRQSVDAAILVLADALGL